MSSPTCVIRVTKTARKESEKIAAQLRMRPPHVYDVLVRLWKQSSEESRLAAVAAQSGLATAKAETGGGA